MKRLYPSKFLIPILILLGISFNVGAQTVTSFTTAGSYNYTVLATTTLSIDMAGAQGGASLSSQGGKGGRVQALLAVTPGQVITVNVGGVGTVYSYCVSRPGGINGGGIGYGYGGSGGGASDIRVAGTTLTNRVLVAAGGGGGGYNCGTTNGENGGDGGGLTGTIGMQCSAANAAIGGSGGTQTAGGAGASSYGQPAGTLGAGGSATGSYCYAGGGGGGYYGGGAGAYGGGGGGSSFIAGPGVSSATTTSAYQSNNGFVTITELCTPIGTISGSAPVCPGSTLTLTTSATAPGTWTSSNTAIATINPSTGVLTAVAPGTVTITYAVTNPCGGASATTSVTVKPLPGPINGTLSACMGNSTTLSNAGGGTWVSSNTSVATINASGVVSAITAGTTTISYTLPTGCAPATAVYTVFPTPAPIGGTAVVCVGSNSTLTNTLTGGSWTSSNPLAATIGALTGVLSGLSAGSTNITYTSLNGCVISTPATVNPLPAPISGASVVCAGSTITLTDATPGGTWSSSNVGLATVVTGTGVVTGVVAGTPTITYTLAGTGCRSTLGIVINPVPGAISGSASVCVGASTTLTNAGSGTWSTADVSLATVNPFTGSLTGVAAGSTIVTYTLPSGCFSITGMVVNPIPTPYALTGGGSYCASGAGVHIGLTYAASGINYVLYNAGIPVSIPVPGSNSGLDFGLQTSAGIYTVVASNSISTCSAPMTGSVTVSINPLPSVNNITGGGNFCVGSSGVPLGTDGSNIGIKYQLYNGSTAVGPLVNGTGAPLSFGSYTSTGTYTVMAINSTTGCTQLQGSNAVVGISPVPTAFNVTGGGGYCAGGTGVAIDMVNSDAGTDYQLFRGGLPIGTPTTSTGGAFSFGLFTTAGTYSVVASNGIGCTASMPGTATVIINPAPAVNNVTGGGSYCAGGTGVHIGLDFSTPGITYTLLYGGGPVTSMAGSGSGLDFGILTVGGTYTVMATNSTTYCSSNMSGTATITVNTPPNGYLNVLGSGSYCSGGTGRDISTDFSEGGVNYQLFRGTTPVGLPLPGYYSGAAVDFGNYTVAGVYTVKATNATTGCFASLSGNATISVNPLPALHTVTGGGNYCDGGAGMNVILNGSNTGITYTLMLGGSSIISSLSGTGGAINFGLQATPGVYTVVATDVITGCSKNMLGSATIAVNPLPNPYVVTGGGSYCAGGTGFHINLSASDAGVSYQLFNGTPSGTAIVGSGSTVDFGIRTAGGAYTVNATNLLTGCSNVMTGSALINVNPLPTLQVLTGGGNYCASGTGLDVSLLNSDLGIRYQLYNAGTPLGTPFDGLGTALSFGLETVGSYTVKATDTTSGCQSNMLGTVSVNTVAPTAYTVTGGGAFCAGGTGVVVNLSGSSLGNTYQLKQGTTLIGVPVSGTGSGLSFGAFTAPGSYTVEARDTTLSCVGNMAGSAVVVVNSLPVAQTVNGGGAFCAGAAGVPVGLTNSISGISYQLMNGATPVGSPVPGITGTALSFGPQSVGGTYTAVAVNTTTGCTNLMSGSATITIKPTPTPYTVTIENFGNYCASDSGLHIGLINSQTGVNYQLFRGSATVGGAIAGTGAALNMGLQNIAGSYTVVGVNPTSTCSANMLGSVPVNIVPLPDVHNVTGGGNYCSGGTGVAVGIDGSTIGTSYQLYNASTLVATNFGTGVAIDFGLQTAAGNYTVVANSSLTPCQNNMFGSADVVVDAPLVPNITMTAYPGAGIHVWQVDSIRVQVLNGGPNPTYQWYINTHMVAGATSATFTHQSFFNNDSVSCRVTSSGPCGGATASKYIIINLIGVGVNPVANVANDVKLVPNPNKGVFSLKGSVANASNEELTIEVTNMLGQVVYTGKAATVNGNIDTNIEMANSLANGMYLLNLRSATENTVFHFVIEK